VIREALDAGARGFVLKSDAARDLVSAIEALQRNRMFFTPRVNDMVLAGFLDKGHNGSNGDSSKSPTLTPREREVIQLLAEGKSSKEVACLLNLSTKTAETHRSNIMRKLDIHSIRDLVVYAVKNDIIQVQGHRRRPSQSQVPPRRGWSLLRAANGKYLTGLQHAADDGLPKGKRGADRAAPRFEKRFGGKA